MTSVCPFEQCPQCCCLTTLNSYLSFRGRWSKKMNCISARCKLWAGCSPEALHCIVQVVAIRLAKETTGQHLQRTCSPGSKQTSQSVTDLQQRVDQYWLLCSVLWQVMFSLPLVVYAVLTRCHLLPNQTEVTMQLHVCTSMAPIIINIS